MFEQRFIILLRIIAGILLVGAVFGTFLPDARNDPGALSDAVVTTVVYFCLWPVALIPGVCASAILADEGVAREERRRIVHAFHSWSFAALALATCLALADGHVYTLLPATAGTYLLALAAVHGRPLVRRRRVPY